MNGTLVMLVRSRVRKNGRGKLLLLLEIVGAGDFASTTPSQEIAQYLCWKLLSLSGASAVLTLCPGFVGSYPLAVLASLCCDCRVAF